MGLCGESELEKILGVARWDGKRGRGRRGEELRWVSCFWLGKVVFYG